MCKIKACFRKIAFNLGIPSVIATASAEGGSSFVFAGVSLCVDAQFI